MCNNPKQANGFTMVELMITIAILGILMMMAVPSFEGMIRNNRLTTYANELVTAMNIARSESIKRNQNVVVRKTGAEWEDGWQVFVDADGGNDFDNGEEILRVYAALPTPYTLRGNGTLADYIRYRPDGTSGLMGSFAVCAKSTPEPYTSRLIIVSMTGRIRMGKNNSSGVPTNGTTALSSCTSP